jgi:hypothetical protein
LVDATAAASVYLSVLCAGTVTEHYCLLRSVACDAVVASGSDAGTKAGSVLAALQSSGGIVGLLGQWFHGHVSLLAAQLLC